MLKKIIFKTLQRLDLKDANELQEGVIAKIDALSRSILPFLDIDGQLSTRPVSKMKFAGNSGGILTPQGPVIVYTSEPDLVVIDQDAIDNGELFWDYTQAYADYVTDHNRGSTPTGLYFYGYPKEEETDNESREFYNPIDGTAFNQDVFTRSKKKFTTFVNLQAAYNVPDANGNYPVLFCYVEAANIDPTVSLPGSPFNASNMKSLSQWQEVSLSEGDFVDSSLPNVSNGRAATTNGGDRFGQLEYSDVNEDNNITRVFKRIDRQLARIIGMGSSDPTDTDLLTYHSKPVHSLQGLRKRQEVLEARATTLEDKTIRASIVYHYKYDTSSSTPITAEFIEYNGAGENDFPVQAMLDYSFLKNIRGVTPEPIDTINVNNRQFVASQIALYMSSSYSGYKILDFNAEFLEDDGTTQGFLTNRTRDTFVLNGDDLSVPQVLRETNFAGTDYNTIGNISVVDASDTQTTLTGIKCFISPNSVFGVNNDREVAVRFNITLKKP